MTSETHILKVALLRKYVRCPRAGLLWHITATADKSSLSTTGMHIPRCGDLSPPLGLTRVWQKGRTKIKAVISGRTEVERKLQKSGREPRVSQHLKVCSVRLE